MLSYSYRFHGHNSLRYVFKNGESVRSRYLTLRYARNTHRKTPRFSVSISKKVLKSAVKRNRVRRRIYEVLRLILENIKPGYDSVFIVATSELYDAPYEVVEEAVCKLLEEATLLTRGDL